MKELYEYPVLGGKKKIKWNFSSHHKVDNPPQVPLALTAFTEFSFHLFLLERRRTSSSTLVSWSKRISKGTILKIYFTASSLNGFPSPLQFQETGYITYLC